MIPVENNLNALLNRINSTTKNYEETLALRQNEEQNYKEKLEKLLLKIRTQFCELNILHHGSPNGSELDQKTFTELKYDLEKKNHKLTNMLCDKIYY